MIRPRSHALRFAALAGAGLLLAACGSVADPPSVGVASGDDTNLSPGAAVVPTTAVARESGLGAGSPTAPIATLPRTGGGSSGTVATTPAGGGSDAAVTTPAGGKPPGNAPGVTDAEIRIGVPVVNDAGSIYKSLGSGAGAASAEQTEAQVRAIFNYINSHGGAAGRKLVPDFYLYSEGSGTFTTQGQAICEHFTKDTKVPIVVAGGNNTMTLANCLASHGVVMLDIGNSEVGDSVMLNRLSPYYYRPFMANLDSLGVVIDAMSARGVLKRGQRIGALRFDTPQHDRAMTNVVKPALARNGITLTDEYEYTYIDTVSALGTSSAQTNNAILKFQNDRIDTVLFVGTQGVVPFFFMPAAQNQNYHPTYVGSSMDIPGFMVTDVPPDQIAKFYGLGWNRVYDLDWNGVFPHDDIPEWKQCNTIANQTGPGHIVFQCDAFFFVAAAMNHATEVSAVGIRAALDRLGAGLVAAESLALSFTSREADGVAAARPFEYAAKCKCMVYVGDTVALP